MVDIKIMSVEELKELQVSISVEIEKRRHERFMELTQAAADALNALSNAYPTVSLCIDGTNPDDGYYETNVFDHYNHFQAEHFCR